MSKRKESAKEKREREKAERRAKYQKKNIEIEKKLLAQNNSEEKKDLQSACLDKKSKQKKSGAKANGLKSLLIVGDTVQMTSFGRGNETVIEKEVTGDVIKNVNTDNPCFDAKTTEKQYEIKRVGVALPKAGYIDKSTAIRNDLIGAKSVLETNYFGEPKNDNVHIQVIYNILDMEKILSSHIDNIIYSIVNVLKLPGDAPYDLIGSLGDQKYDNFRKPGKDKYSAFQTMYKDERLRFFGGAFYETGFDIKAKKTKDSDKKRTEEEVYYMFKLLGCIRQFTKHGGEKKPWLYLLDTQLLQPEKDLLDKIYDTRINDLNKDFIKKSENDLSLAIKALSIVKLSDKQRLVEDYYRYIVHKEARNIGFSVKKLRENMVEKYAIQLKDKSYNSVRSKMYKLFDFIIFLFYTTEKGANDGLRFIDSLRCAMNDDEKDNAYEREAEYLWSALSDKFKIIECEIEDGSGVSRIQKDNDLDRISLERVKVTAENTSYFAKLMFFMTLFLNGKEINDLLTTIINKLENIQSFEDIMEKNKMRLFEARENGKYELTFFNSSKAIADEIRVVKSVSRMETPLPSARDFMYIEAMKLLGLDDKVEAMTIIKGKHYVETMDMDAESKEKYFNNNNTNSKYEGKTKADFFKGNTAVRNFVCNNIIESSNFQYVIRYTNVETARIFAKCKPIVSFVLNKIPESQIERYWFSCNIDNDVLDKKTRVRRLTDKICTLDSSFLKEKKIKEDKQATTAILGLYLTVVYRIIKGLVNVNSRYTIAIHSLERDTYLLADGKKPFPGEKGAHYDELFAMTNQYIEKQTKYIEERIAKNKRANKHGLACIINSKNSVGNKDIHFHICRIYRNAIAHLGAVSYACNYVDDIKDDTVITSYFALYHFFMQRYLIDILEDGGYELSNTKVKEWSEKVREYCSFNKDWVWALNSPFAYNPSRYKSLSIEELFYIDEEAVIKSKKDK